MRHNARQSDNNSLFFNFLGSDKGYKIKRTVIISDYSNDGLRMIDIKSFNQVLKSTWIKKYLDPANQEKQKVILNSELQNLGGPAVFKGNLNRNDLHDQLAPRTLL